jgi:hypothetical protein
MLANPSAQSRFRRAAAVVAMLVLSATTVVATVSPVTAAESPTMSLQESGPFRDGDSVTADVQGLADGDKIAVVQCGLNVRPSPFPATCGGPSSGFIDSSGGSAVGSIAVRVGALADGYGTRCEYGRPCVIVVIVLPEVVGTLPSSAVQLVQEIEFTSDAVPQVPPTPSGQPTVSYSPRGALTAGTQVVVTVTGMTPRAPVAIAQCAKGRVVLGPSDCAPVSRGASTLIEVDGVGTGSGELTLLVGPLLNEQAPATVCSATDPCKVVAINIADQAQSAWTPIAISGSAIAPKVGMALTKKSVKKRKPTKFKGLVGPNQAGQEARLQRKIGKKWVTVKKARLSMASRYSITLRPKSTKDRYWRVMVPKTRYHKGAYSKAKKLKVR